MGARGRGVGEDLSGELVPGWGLGAGGMAGDGLEAGDAAEAGMGPPFVPEFPDAGIGNCGGFPSAG